MALQCMNCLAIYEVNSILVKCSKCGNGDPNNWCRTESKIDHRKHERNKKFLQYILVE